MILTYLGTVDSKCTMNSHPLLSKLAVQLNGNNLEYIFDKTYELCKLAVQDNNDALKFVDEEFQTDELLNIVFRKDNYNKSLLQYCVKEKYKYELCKKDIKYDGNKTYELCKLALENNSNAILFVPNKYFLEPYGEELFNIAIKNDKSPLLCLIKQYYNIKLEFNKM